MAKVFFLVDSLPLGGVTSYVKTICGALARRGHDVTIVINEGEDRSEEPWPAGVALHTLPVGPLDTRAGMTAKLRKLLLQSGAEWVFFNNCYYTDSYAVREGSMQGVYVIHSNMEEEVDRFAKEGLHCHHLVGPTPGVTARFQRAFPLYHAIHIAHGTHVPDVQIEKEFPFHIVYLGRLSPEKGVDLIPPIVAPLLNRYPDMRLTVLGNGRGREEYAEGVRAAFRAAVKNPSQLHMPGTLSREALDGLLRAAHVVLLPSREEAFGLAAIEGAAMGAVPVVTRIAGVTDRIFENGKEAFLCVQDEVEQFSSAIERLYQEPLLRQQMATAAYQKVSAQYSVDAMAAAYETLMASPPMAAPVPLNATQRAFGVYRHLLFLKARKAIG